MATTTYRARLTMLACVSSTNRKAALATAFRGVSKIYASEKVVARGNE